MNTSRGQNLLLECKSLRSTFPTSQNEIKRNLPDISIHFIEALAIFCHVKTYNWGAIDSISEVVGLFVMEAVLHVTNMTQCLKIIRT